MANDRPFALRLAHTQAAATLAAAIIARSDAEVTPGNAVALLKEIYDLIKARDGLAKAVEVES